MNILNEYFNINNMGGTNPITTDEASQLVSESAFVIFAPMIRDAHYKASRLCAAQYLRKIYLLYIWNPHHPN